MKRNLKKDIVKAFTPPEPRKRDAFLRSLPYPKLTYPEFVLGQIKYIRKRFWLVSAAVLIAASASAYVAAMGIIQTVWVISAFIPFLAVLTAAEISHSDVFGMSETETVCRFSLPQLTAARLMILGVFNLAALTMLTAVSEAALSVGAAKAALYIFTPYITVNGISLAVMSRIKGQEGVYSCAAAALGVSIAGFVIFGRGMLDERMTAAVNAVLCIFGIIIAVKYTKKLMLLQT